jgi:hypothetical protein
MAYIHMIYKLICLTAHVDEVLDELVVVELGHTRRLPLLLIAQDWHMHTQDWHGHTEYWHGHTGLSSYRAARLTHVLALSRAYTGMPHGSPTRSEAQSHACACVWL